MSNENYDGEVETNSDINYGIKNTELNSNSVSFEQNLENNVKISGEIMKSKSETRIDYDSKFPLPLEKNSDSAHLKNSIEIYNLKNIVKQSVDGLNDMLNSKIFNNTLKKEKMINFDPIDEIEEDFEIKNSKLIKMTMQNSINSGMKKHELNMTKNVLTPNNMKKMNKSNISDKMNLTDKNNTKNKYSKTLVNKFLDKKPFLEMNKPAKISENSTIKKSTEDRTTPHEFNKTLVKDNKKVYKVGNCLFTLEIDYNKSNYKTHHHTNKIVYFNLKKVPKNVKGPRKFTKSQSPQLISNKIATRQSEEKQTIETVHSPLKNIKELKFTPKSLKNDKLNSINTSFMGEGLKRDVSSKKLDKQKSLKSTATSRNKIGFLQNKEVSSQNTIKQDMKNSFNPKLTVIQQPKIEKIDINPKTLLELIYILNEISGVKDNSTINPLRNSYQDLNKIFKSYLDYNTDEELSKNNSATTSNILLNSSRLLQNHSFERRRTELNKRRDEKKTMHILIIQRTWREYQMRKALNIKDNLLKFKKNDIIRMCKNSLIDNLLKCDQFKVIINLLTQTLSLWGDFLKNPSKLVFNIVNNMTKTNIINFRNENLNESNSYSNTLSKFITNVIKLNKIENESITNNDITIDNKDKSVSISITSEKTNKSPVLFEKNKI